MARLYTAGTLAYYDTFAGMIPCKVVKVEKAGFGNHCGEGCIVVRLTASRGAYKRGEVIEASAPSIVPRPHRYLKSGQYRVHTGYYWATGECPVVHSVPA